MDGNGVPITTYISVSIVAIALISALWQIKKTGYFQRCCNGQKDSFANTNTFDTTTGTTAVPVERAATPAVRPPLSASTQQQTIQFKNEKIKKDFNKTVPKPPPMPARTILPKSKTQQTSGFSKSKPIKFSRW